MYGYAFQFGRDDVDIASSAASLDTDNYSLSLYGTLPQNNNQFIDGLIGVGTLKTDHIRKKNSNNLIGERDGNQVFSSIKFNKIFNKKNFDINPFTRIDLGFTELKTFSETGSNDALIYEKHQIPTKMASFGTLIGKPQKFNNGSMLIHNGRLEYTGDFSPSNNTSVSYVTDPTTDYTLTVSNRTRDNLRAGIGFDLSTDNGFSTIINYERYASKGSGHTDIMYFTLGWVSKRKTEYAITFNGTDNTTASFDHIKNIKGFDLNFNFDVHPFSEKINQQANLNLSKSF